MVKKMYYLEFFVKPKSKEGQDALLERIELSEQQVFELRYESKMNELIERETKEVAPSLRWAQFLL